MKDKEITWHDANREPQVPFNREDAWGLDIDGTGGRLPSCTVNLPWPAQRCGSYVVKCLTCGFTIGLTTAGRIDDPRSVKIPCREKSTAH